MENFDLGNTMPLLDSPEKTPENDPTAVFDTEGEVRWLIREN